MAYGKSVNLFLVNGKADNLVIAELKNWDAKAIRIPRIEVPACDRAELQQQGVFFLTSDKVDNNTTTEDILFTSPSAAADFLVGYSVSGPANWKDKKRTALKDRTDI
ncbi:MAG: DUF4357 domain-containing protein [Lachnospiraceae bacterium]|nr:DUF4357 domain-containing protein [Lachnospiraceae bacterium]